MWSQARYEVGSARREYGASKVQESADRLLPLVTRCACARTTALRTGRRDKHGIGWRRMRRGGGTTDAGLHTRDTHETKDDSARFKHASRLSSHVVCTRARADNSHGKASEGDWRSLAVTVPYRPAKVWRDEGCYCAGCAMRCHGERPWQKRSTVVPAGSLIDQPTGALATHAPPNSKSQWKRLGRSRTDRPALCLAAAAAGKRARDDVTTILGAASPVIVRVLISYRAAKSPMGHGCVTVCS